MTPMTDLDRELDRRLQQLPGPKAPMTLMPRILAAVSVDAAPVHPGTLAPLQPCTLAPTPLEQLSPWYSRPWLTWPYALRVASAAVVIVAVAAFVGGLPLLRWLSPGLAAFVDRALDPLQSVARTVGQTVTLARVFWHVWLEPIALYLLALIVMLSLAVATALSLVNRLTPERT